MGNDQTKFVALAIIPKVTSSISIPCQIWIIKEVIADHLAGRGKATSRALLGMGCVDIMASFGWFLSTWAAPSETAEEGVPFASGNQRTCSFQGFLLQLAIGAPMYNCALSLYYLLSIRHGWNDGQLRRVEYALHGCIITFAAGTGFALIPVGVYNHIGAVCWVMGKPQGCGHSNYTPNEDVECERGENAWIYGISLFYGPLWICILLTTAAMVLIHRKVRDTERKTRRYSGTTARRTNDVFLQALLYTVAFYVTWMPSTIWSITHWFDTPMYWLDVLATMCEPSQGLLNLLVFVRPRKDLRRKLRRDILTVLSCGFIRPDVAASRSGADGTSSRHRSSMGEGSDAAEFNRRRNRVSMLNMNSTMRTSELLDHNIEMACQRVKFEGYGGSLRSSVDIGGNSARSECHGEYSLRSGSVDGIGNSVRSSLENENEDDDDNFAENYPVVWERRSSTGESDSGDEEEKKSISERHTSVTFLEDSKLDDIDETMSGCEEDDDDDDDDDLDLTSTDDEDMSAPTISGNSS